MRQLLIISLLLTSAVCGRSANFLVLQPSPFPAVVNAGDTFSIEVDLFADDTLFGFQFDLLFPAFLNVTGVTEQGFFADQNSNSFCCFSFDAPDNAAGTVTNVLDASIGGGLQGFGLPLVTFQFLAVGSGSGQVSLQNVLLADDQFDNLVTDQSSPVDVTATQADAPEPSSTVALAVVAGLVVALMRRKRSVARRAAR